VASKPANVKLYEMVVAQAKARFATYPSPGASHWVHQQYVQHGGQFTITTPQTRKMDALKKKDTSKVEAKESEHKKDDKDGKKDK
jgi:hypothetical protein